MKLPTRRRVRERRVEDRRGASLELQQARKVRKQAILGSKVQHSGCGTVCPIHGKTDIEIVRLETDERLIYQCMVCGMALGNAKHDSRPTADAIPLRMSLE